MNDKSLVSIRQRYGRVMEKIADSARQSGRDPEEVRLVVVTKQQPVDKVREVIDAGARMLGENYADEAVQKMNALRDLHGVQWHMIGHVQSRKARIVAREFSYLHSLDSLKLAEKLDSISAEIDRKLPVLLEFNVSGEVSKSGFAVWNENAWRDLLPDIERILAFPHLDVCGLMTMAPYFDQPELARPLFRELRSFQAVLRKRFPECDWNQLSMGMSGDFEAAIQEGATMVRIGTGIMGSRPKTENILKRGR